MASAHRRGFIVLVDQAMSSVSNFAIGIAVARVAGAAGLGAFSLAYTLWLIIAAMHRALVTDPMAIEGDARRGDRAGIEHALAAELLLGLGGALLLVAAGIGFFVAGMRNFGIGMLALAPWLPTLVLQDFWRWIGFLTHRPTRTLANDTVFNIVQAGAFVAVFLTATNSAGAVIGAWGVGGLAGALFGLRQHHRFSAPRDRATERCGWRSKLRAVPTWLGSGWRLLRTRWEMSRWIAGSSLLTWLASQGSTFVIGIALGAATLGLYSAAATLATGPAYVLIQAGGAVGLPEATKAFDERGWAGLASVARWITIAGLLSVGGCALGVLLVGREVLSHVYGSHFASAEPVAVVLVLSLLLYALRLGPILCFKATRRTRTLFRLQAVTLLVDVLAPSILAVRFGILGAAYGVAISIVVTVAVSWVAYLRLRREMAVSETVRSTGPPQATTSHLS